MTFALRDFVVLKEKFNEALITILRREKVETIDELPQKRREEYQFLVSVFSELEARIKESKTTNLKPFIEIFYGAMLVIQQDVKDNLGWGEKPERSLLFNDLNEVMGIDIKNNHIPSIHQYAHWYTSVNNFLTLIYKDSDSRKGLKSPNALDAISIDRLTTLITTSYTLEEAAINKVTSAFVSGGKETNVNLYKVTKDTPASALAGFTTWEKLKEDLNSLVLDQRADKNVSNITSVPNPIRVAQIQSLQAVAEALTDPKPTDKKSKNTEIKIKESERIAILAGMMLLIREQIGDSYGKAPLSTSSTASLTQAGSVMHTGLSKILKIEGLSREDAQALITAARSFFTHMSLERTEVKEVVKDAVRTKNIFSGINKFNATSVLDWMEKLINSYRLSALQSCVKQYKENLEALKPKEPSHSYTSYLNVAGWLGKKPVGTDEHDTEAEQDDALKTNVSQPL